jgi:hypothetical protein
MKVGERKCFYEKKEKTINLSGSSTEKILRVSLKKSD